MTNHPNSDPSTRVQQLTKSAWTEVFTALSQRHTVWGRWVSATATMPAAMRPVDITAKVFADVPALTTTSLVEGVERIELPDGLMFVVEVRAGEEVCPLVVTDGHPDERLRFAPLLGKDDDGSALVAAKPSLLLEIEGLHMVPLIDALLDMIETGLADAGIADTLPPSQ